MGEEQAAGAWPTKHALAKAWDASDLVREQLRSHSKLLTWPNPAATGVANKKSLRINRFVMMPLMRAWVDHSSLPKSPPIGWIRQEVARLLYFDCSKRADRFQCYFRVFGIRSILLTNYMLHVYSFLDHTGSRQVQEVYRLLVQKPDTVCQYTDEWGCKRFVSFLVRRYRTGMVVFRDRALVAMWFTVYISSRELGNVGALLIYGVLGPIILDLKERNPRHIV